jgi:hypothetical protein
MVVLRSARRGAGGAARASSDGGCGRASVGVSRDVATHPLHWKAVAAEEFEEVWAAAACSSSAASAASSGVRMVAGCVRRRGRRRRGCCELGSGMYN